NGAFFDLFRHQPDTDEDRDEYAENEHCSEPCVDDRPGFLAVGQFAKQDRRRRYQQDKKHEIIQDPVPDRLAKRVLCNDENSHGCYVRSVNGPAVLPLYKNTIIHRSYYKFCETLSRFVSEREKYMIKRLEHFVVRIFRGRMSCKLFILM